MGGAEGRDQSKGGGEREGFLRTKTEGREERIGTSISSYVSSSVYIYSR